MSESNSGQEKTEQPTPKRINEAKEKGEVVRSRELNTMLVTMSSAIVIIMLGKQGIEDILNLLSNHLSPDRSLIFNKVGVIKVFYTAISDGLVLMLPMFFVVFVVALFGPALVGGFSFNVKALAPKFDRLDPIKGIKRVFSARGLMELVKALAKFLLVLIVAGVLFFVYMEDFLKLGSESVLQAISHSGSIFIWSFLALSSALIVIASIDVPFQIWDHFRKLKMTRQEVKDELKQTDGDPELKGKIKSLQREFSQRRMMEDIPDADVVIVNPTHYAVALKYDNDKSNAPILVAKGSDFVALKIREIAKQHDVMIFSAPPLARAIYHTTEIKQEIPASLYVAVAQVLAYVFQVNNVRRYGGLMPAEPTDLSVPDDY